MNTTKRINKSSLATNVSKHHIRAMRTTPGLVVQGFFSLKKGLERLQTAVYRFCRPVHYHFATAPILAILLINSNYVYASPVSLEIISQIESSGNPKAVGDSGKALGLFQLHQGVVVDYNRTHNTSYLHQDALDSTISHKIASWYLNTEIPRLLKHFKQPLNLENILTSYNMGILAVKNGRLAHGYISKYKKLAVKHSPKNQVEIFKK